MNSPLKKAISIILSISLVLIIGSNSNAAIQLPENIRVGLYYASTAVSTLKVSADKGMQLGCFADDVFNSLSSDYTNRTITIRKDAYYVCNKTVLKEYLPTDKVIPSGDKLGPFHVQIGGDYQDAESTDLVIQAIKLLGVNCYIVYTGVWQIWTGFYIDLSLIHI